mgnify:CR=1 FL=1
MLFLTPGFSSPVTVSGDQMIEAQNVGIGNVPRMTQTGGGYRKRKVLFDRDGNLTDESTEGFLKTLWKPWQNGGIREAIARIVS